MTTLLGFDYGTRKIGIAVGQTVTGSATALKTLRSRDGRPDWEEIGRMIGEWQPEALVVGLPHDLDDSETEIADRARRFSRQLHGRYRLPVHLMDERLTSMEARRHAPERLANRDHLDAIAAKLILETWLSEQR
jgi:putative Holliday junction resolvase